MWDVLVFWMICKPIPFKKSLYNIERKWKYWKCLEAALCEISSLEQINEAWLDGGKINLHSLIRCNPLGAILTPLKLQKVRALTHACLNVLHVHILNAESPSTSSLWSTWCVDLLKQHCQFSSPSSFDGPSLVLKLWLRCRLSHINMQTGTLRATLENKERKPQKQMCACN